MKILFLNKGDVNQVSGGYIYNRKMIEYGIQTGHSLTHADHINDVDYQLHVVDSLMLSKEDLFEKKTLEKTIALIHQLPNDSANVLFSSTIAPQLKYIVTGKDVKSELSKKWTIAPGNIAIIEPGVDTNWKRRHTIPTNFSKLLMVANYLPGKGYDQLVSLIPVLNEFNCTLSCFGNKSFDPAYFEKIQKEISEQDHENRIVFNEVISSQQLNEQFLAADLLLSTSISETFGMVINEAIFANLPCLIYKTGNWEAFEKSGLAAVVQNENVLLFNQTLIKIISGKHQFEMPKNSAVRTWEDAGEAFYSTCEKWILQ